MMIIHDVPQGEDEWRALRVGKITASRFSDALAGGEGKSRDLYMRQLAGEIITGDPMETFQSEAMRHGTAVEDEARKLYSMVTDQDVQKVGFISDGRLGCSPDGLIGSDGMVEIKRQAPHLLIERIRTGKGSTHDAQCQGNMMVANRKWLDLVVYYPRMPLWRKRIKRDENHIYRLKLGLDTFIEDLDQLVAQIRAYK